MFSPYNKYSNKKTTYNGVVFDSSKEASYARQLDLLKNARDPENRVVSWDRQVKFLLQPAFVDNKGKSHQKIEYWADFKVLYADGHEEIIDVKGFKTEIYLLKLKLLLYKYPDIDFREA